MSARQQAFLYLHGFNSSPDSLKARIFKDYFLTSGLAEVEVPALPNDPARAISLLRNRVSRLGAPVVVGSSLGGFYATVLAEQFGLKAVLINPAVPPFDDLADRFIGPQKNYYTDEEYEFTLENAHSLIELIPERLHRPENYLVFVQAGDETLDYRKAVAYYRGASLHVQEGGSHAFDGFEKILPRISAFAGLSASH